eukprot:scaffold53574_cov46-Phaeocystis_antarctica.AAC.4
MLSSQSCGERHCDCSDRKRRGVARDGTTRKRSLTELLICPTLRTCERADRHVTAHRLKLRLERALRPEKMTARLRLG